MPFEARDYPTVIWLRDEPVAGPFCVHCGYPMTLHSDDGLRCPTKPNLLLGPSCDCHVIDGDPCVRCGGSGRRQWSDVGGGGGLSCPHCSGGKINLRIVRKEAA